jgi:hypothetical protein
MSIAPASVTSACLPDVPKRVHRASRGHRPVGQRGARATRAGSGCRSIRSHPSLPTPPIVGDLDGPPLERLRTEVHRLSRKPPIPLATQGAAGSHRPAAPKRHGGIEPPLLCRSADEGSRRALCFRTEVRCPPPSCCRIRGWFDGVRRISSAAEAPESFSRYRQPVSRPRGRSPAGPAHRGVRSWPGLRLVPADDVPD